MSSPSAQSIVQRRAEIVKHFAVTEQRRLADLAAAEQRRHEEDEAFEAEKAEIAKLEAQEREKEETEMRELRKRKRQELEKGLAKKPRRVEAGLNTETSVEDKPNVETDISKGKTQASAKTSETEMQDVEVTMAFWEGILDGQKEMLKRLEQTIALQSEMRDYLKDLYNVGCSLRDRGLMIYTEDKKEQVVVGGSAQERKGGKNKRR
ncbi:hypothetical protein BDY19DRAFT_904417 [Irpex rosettiformis]|uniref:Uncharacterized protein n=1 Tax=Irpex rosettiformis TaxID=378272 RepID=A0ACB8UC43_9APHY|nr:hypothetical protein BDY19DRAFT_904417 [Irpex rosettiformis]